MASITVIIEVFSNPLLNDPGLLSTYSKASVSAIGYLEYLDGFRQPLLIIGKCRLSTQRFLTVFDPFQKF
jgi:hypothetical protein